MAHLSPMSRLLIVVGLTSVGADNVRFVDADRASFSYTSGDPEQPAQQPRISSTQTAGADEGGGGKEGVSEEAGGGVGSGTRRRRRRLQAAGEPGDRQQQQQQRQQQPRPGQVGLLEFDPRGRGSEFVVSPALSLPERLTVTADVVSPAYNPSAAAPPAGSADDQQRPGATQTGGAPPVTRVVRGGGAGVSSGGQQGDETSAREPVCVKYLDTVGESVVQRSEWFPSPEDAASLRRAIDAYCPLSFLRSQEGEEEGVRRLLLYQRDQNRQILHADKVVEDLQERLGGGWIVNMMMHDSDRHPCVLVETLAGVDVLLTPHGFQSMLGLFMRPGSLLFEVFPQKYFKAGYAPMAEGLDVRHAYSMSRALRPMMGHSYPSTETCMKWYLCRWYARSSDVELDEESLERLVDLAAAAAAPPPPSEADGGR
ncbi:unnamed protein product [Ectocarpus sp. CCAP 1310/34]|nr:unnamed protein product [Ectocarpus sp. CCAP 1310/34]